jgi:hypothetical protein
VVLESRSEFGHGHCGRGIGSLERGIEPTLSVLGGYRRAACRTTAHNGCIAGLICDVRCCEVSRPGTLRRVSAVRQNLCVDRLIGDRGLSVANNRRGLVLRPRRRCMRPPRARSVIPVTPLMHIRPDQRASTGCKDIPARQVFIYSQPPLLQSCPTAMAAQQSLCALQHIRARAGFKCGRDPVRKIALIPHKQAISIQ